MDIQVEISQRLFEARVNSQKDLRVINVCWLKFWGSPKEAVSEWETTRNKSPGM